MAYGPERCKPQTIGDNLYVLAVKLQQRSSHVPLTQAASVSNEGLGRKMLQQSGGTTTGGTSGATSNTNNGPNSGVNGNTSGEDPHVF